MMASSQRLPLSQDANKSNGKCPVCSEVHQLHLKDGKLHRHGPRHRPCSGSNQLPENIDVQPQAPTNVCSSAVSTGLPITISSNPSTTHTPHISTTNPLVSQPRVESEIIKHIPKSARPSSSSLLSSLINKVNTNPDDLESWSSILNFGRNILVKPARTGRRHNSASIIKKRTEADTQSEGELIIHPEVRHKKRDASSLLAAAVTAKIEDGNIKAAIRILSSEEKPAVDEEATYKKLTERHPAPPVDRDLAPDPRHVKAIQVEEEDVMKAIRTFPAGSSGGPDGIRPQHILDLVSCRETGQELLRSITGFVNILLEGKCNKDIMPILFVGQLIALEKK